MRLPNKTTPYNRSIIPYFPRIAAALSAEDAAPMTVYNVLEIEGKNVGDYLDALDCLFAIGRLTLTEGGLLHYAG